MATKTFHGSCHCKKVRFEADIDLAAGTGKCNCSFCWKVRNWSAGIKPEAFRLLEGKEHITEYGFRAESLNRHVFCRLCGVRLYTHGYIEQIGGAFVSIALATLDDLPVADLVEAPVRYLNGRDDAWFTEPAEHRHL
jgi:hypothetical protein